MRLKQVGEKTYYIEHDTNIGAVSYTHLDVYKRQQSGHIARSAGSIAASLSPLSLLIMVKVSKSQYLIGSRLM